MHRSRFIGSVALLLALATHAAGAEAPPRWNILFCFADDWGRYASCYAPLDRAPTVNTVIKTPNIDRVAAEGVLFRHAFVNSPSCTPCRSSLLSGRFFFNTGRAAILQGAIWDNAIPSFPLLLRDAGYHIGKTHKVWSPGVPRDAPFGGQQYAYERRGIEAAKFSLNATRRISAGTTVAEARDAIVAQVAQNFDDFLAACKPGQPWHYFFGANNTHRPWVKGSGRALWQINPDHLKGRMPPFFPDVPDVREDLADYLGECQAFDAYVGALRQRLEAAGELERTLIVLSGDNGIPGFINGKCNLYDGGVAVALVMRVPGGERGRLVDDFVCLPDLAPTFLEVAGIRAPDGLYGRSLLPVLRSFASGQVDPGRTFVITGRERHGAEVREGNLPYPMRALRTRDFLYIRNFAPERSPMGDPLRAFSPEALGGGLEKATDIGYGEMDAGPTKAWLVAHRKDPQWQWQYTLAFEKRPGEELYDLAADRDQTKNVASDPTYAAAKSELSARLMDVLTRARDPRVIGDGKAFDRPPFTDPASRASERPVGKTR